MEQLLDERTRQQVKEVLQSLNKDVAIIFFGSQSQNCTYCGDTKQLVTEVASLSEKIHLEIYELEKHPEESKKYHVDTVPCVIVASYDQGKIVDHGVRYLGIPAGHEFTSLIRSVLMVSSGDSGLQPATREFLAGLKSPMTLQVFVTPT